jgi:CRP-like cAMP-binding protein
MATPPLDRSLIRDLAVFAAVPPADLDALLATATARRYPEGATAYRQDEPAGQFFVLLGGRMKAVQTTPDGVQVVIRHIGPGDLFGLAHAMRRPTYPASAIAVTDSVALAWPDSQWAVMTARVPQLAANAMATMGQRLDDAHTRVRELATEAVERRVAHALLRLVRQAGRKTEAGILIDFPLTRQDIAEMTGTTLYTVSRLLTAWEAKGLVASARRQVTVRDPHALVLLADGDGAAGDDTET